MIVATKEMDPDFLPAIEGKPEHWRIRAIAGLTAREVYCGPDPRLVSWAREHGLSRAHTEAEREAWLFGFEWPENALRRARSVICDLLQGRALRMHAEETLRAALRCEELGAPRYVVVRELERAAHWEWIAMISERGQVLWGGRLNRCGRQERVENDGANG